jgi:hypothetical protein
MGLNVSGESHVNWLEQVSNNKPLNPPCKDTNTGRNTLDNGVFSGDNCTINFKKLPDIFPQPNPITFNVNPKETIDKIRSDNNNGSQFRVAVLFQNKLDNMSEADLKTSRDYLLDLIADPSNNDDPFLFNLLKMVNKELDQGHETFKPGVLGGPEQWNHHFRVD